MNANSANVASIAMDPKAETFFQSLEDETNAQFAKLHQTLPEEVKREENRYGFPISDSVPNPRKIKLDNWFAGRDRLVKRIKSDLGVKPLAVVHRETWSKLCKKSGLFRLRVSRKGGVYADTAELKWIRGTAKVSFSNLALFLLHSLVGVLMMAAISMLISSVVLGESVAIYGVLIGLLVSTCFGLWKRKEAKNKLSAENGVLHILFPSMTSANSNNNSIAVGFTRPPDELRPLLYKLARSRQFDVEVVADPSSISVDPDKEVLGWGDPIITIISDETESWGEQKFGAHVAIMGQFGDFPAEIEAMDKVLGNVEELFV